MAGDWLQLDFDLWEHRCTQAIALSTGLDSDTVVGKLARVWAWAQTQTTSGKVSPCSVGMIDNVARREGFAQAMIDAGWLETGEGWVRFPKWESHNGKGAKRRLKEAARKAEYREKKRPAPVPSMSRRTRDTNGTVPALEQSRAEQSGASAPLERRAEQSPRSNSPDEVPRPAVHKALVEAGLTRFQATSTIAVADRKQLPDDVLIHAAAECAEQRAKGKEIKNPQNYVEVIVGLRDSVPRKLADRRAAIGEQAQAARQGAPS